MIINITGDILESKCDIICHQVNCKGKMGAGLAKQIKDKYPKVYDAYHRITEHKGESLLGTNQFVAVGSDGVSPYYICNMFGQDGYGTNRLQTDYTALEKCLKDLSQIVKEHRFSVAIPYGIGCGLAGGDWRIVQSLIEKYFDNCITKCYVVKYDK